MCRIYPKGEPPLGFLQIFSFWLLAWLCHVLAMIISAVFVLQVVLEESLVYSLTEAVPLRMVLVPSPCPFGWEFKRKFLSFFIINIIIVSVITLWCD